MDATDPIFKELEETAETIRATKAESLDHLQPRKEKAGWVLGLDDSFDEVAGRLEAAETREAEILGDIDGIRGICGGDRLQPLLDEVRNLQGRITRAARGAEAARRKAELRMKKATLAEIAEDEGVKAAEAELAAARKEAEPEIAKLETRISEARAIIRKYDI